MDAWSKLQVDVPIVLAPMGTAVGSRLAAVVSNAGALGHIPLWRSEPDEVRKAIREIKAQTSRPFAVNLHLHPKWPQEERLDICLEEGVKIVSMFWGRPGGLIERAHRGGATVMLTVGSAEEARRAVGEGADIVIAQGWEAGGHVWGNVATLPLVPAVVDAVSPVPVIAAGGIGDGRGLAAVLALGACAGALGTRFLGALEANIHAFYRDTLIAANETETIYSTLFDGGWPADAPGRTLRNKTVIEWEAAGRPPAGSRRGEGDVVATSASGDILRYQASLPAPTARGDLEAMAMWAGQSVALLRQAQPGAQIVELVWREAQETLSRLGKSTGSSIR